MAIAIHEPHFGMLFDPYHGYADLKKQLLGTLHPLSFVDDPTRIIRAARYSARYNLQVERKTHKRKNI